MPPPSQQTHAETLFAEARAFRTEGEFAQANQLSSTSAFKNAQLNPSQMVKTIAKVYGLDVDPEHIADVVRRVWGG